MGLSDVIYCFLRESLHEHRVIIYRPAVTRDSAVAELFARVSGSVTATIPFVFPRDDEDTQRAFRPIYDLIKETTRGHVIFSTNTILCEERDREAIETALALLYLSV